MGKKRSQGKNTQKEQQELLITGGPLQTVTPAREGPDADMNMHIWTLMPFEQAPCIEKVVFKYGTRLVLAR